MEGLLFQNFNALCHWSTDELKPNAFNQGKFGLKSVQKFIFEPSGLYSIGLVAFQISKVTRAYKVYGICLRLLLKLR